MSELSEDKSIRAKRGANNNQLASRRVGTGISTLAHKHISILKLKYIHRKPRPYGNFSIENYFQTIGEQLSKKVEVSHWNAPFFSKGFFNRFWSMQAVRALRKADIYHITGDTHFLIWGVRRDKKKVLTIHDLGFLRDSKGIKRRILKYFWLTGIFKNFDKSKDTDVWALAHNYVSVVPVQFDLTNHALKASLTKKWKW